jgi:hypothetical protein
VSTTISAHLLAIACSAGPGESATEEPTTGPATPANERCTYTERTLGRDEALGVWPAPAYIAGAMSRSYVGPMRWESSHAELPKAIAVEVRVDADGFVLIAPGTAPGIAEPAFCASMLKVPVETTLRLGGADAVLTGVYVATGPLLKISGALPPSFAAVFAAVHQDGYELFAEVRLDGVAAAGRFEVSKPGVVWGVAGSFVAE